MRTTGDGKPQAIKSQAPLFDATNLVTEQFWATSSDGTKVPYFLIHRKDAERRRCRRSSIPMAASSCR